MIWRNDQKKKKKLEEEMETMRRRSWDQRGEERAFCDIAQCNGSKNKGKEKGKVQAKKSLLAAHVGEDVADRRTRRGSAVTESTITVTAAAAATPSGQRLLSMGDKGVPGTGRNNWNSPRGCCSGEREKWD